MKKKLGWILSLTLCFAMMIAATLVTASADTSVSYIDANGTPLTCASATVVTSNSTTWNDGWYVVNDDVTIDQRHCHRRCASHPGGWVQPHRQ